MDKYVVKFGKRYFKSVKDIGDGENIVRVAEDLNNSTWLKEDEANAIVDDFGGELFRLEIKLIKDKGSSWYWDDDTFNWRCKHNE